MTYCEVMTKGLQLMMCWIFFLCYLCLGRDHGPMDPNGWLKRPVPWGLMNPSRVLLKKCAPKTHRRRQPIKFIPVISLYEGSIIVDFLGYAAMRVRM